MYSYNKTKFENNPWAFKYDWKVPCDPTDAVQGEHYLQLDVLSHVIKTYAFSPCVWQDGVRARDNFLFCKLCVLDVDIGMSVESAIEIFKKHWCIIAASRNHKKIKDGRWAERFRVILMFDDFIIEREHFEYNMQYYTRYFDTDIKAKDAARFYFPCTEILYAGAGEPGFVHLPTLSVPKNERAAAREKRETEINKIIGSKQPTNYMREFDTTGAYTEGGRNDRIYKQAMHMTLKDFDLEAIIEYCRNKTNLTDKEVKATCQSAYNTFIRYKKT